MAYTQKPGRGNGDPIMKLSDKLKKGSGLKLLGDLDKDGALNPYEKKRQAAIAANTSAAKMYGAPVHMKSGKSKIGHISGINYGSPVKHEEGPEGHVHDEKNLDRYTYQSTDIEAGTERTRRARRRLARSLTKEANKTGLDVQGYTTSGSKAKLKLKNKKLTVKTKGKGGAEGDAVDVDGTYSNKNKKVKKRDVRKQLKETGTVTIKDGKVKSGTTQTVTKKGSARIDTARTKAAKEREEKKKALATKKANTEADRKAKKQSTKKTIESRRAEANSEREAAKQKLAESRKAYLEKRKKQKTKTKK